MIKRMISRLLPISLIMLFFYLNGNAQSLEKIKGNRNVTIKQTYVDDFESIVIGNDFSIDLIYNSKPSVEIETDDNLHEVIKFEVVDGILSISPTKRITSKKALKIIVNYGESLNSITVKDKAEVRSLTSMELGSVSLSVNDNGRAYLNIKSEDITFKASGKSKTRLNITAQLAKMELSDDCELDALINTTSTEFDLYQRADATIEGNTEQLQLRIDNSTNFFGNNFSSKQCDLMIEGNSNATIEVSETFTISASGSTETFLYGEPGITIKKLTGSARLQKKER